MATIGNQYAYRNSSNNATLETSHLIYSTGATGVVSNGMLVLANSQGYHEADAYIVAEQDATVTFSNLNLAGASNATYHEEVRAHLRATDSAELTATSGTRGPSARPMAWARAFSKWSGARPR